MVWSKFDDRRAMNRKLREAGFEARGLDEAAICQVSGDGTDGFISEDSVEMLGVAHRCRHWRKVAQRLVDVGRWEPKDGGWLIHDYLDYHPTKAESDEKSERISAARSEAGRRGGMASGEARRQAKLKQLGSEASEATENQVVDEATKPRPVPKSPSPPTSPEARTLAAVPDQADEEEDPLVDRWIATLRPEKRNRHNVLQTRRNIAHLRKYLSEQAIDECIGKAAADAVGGIGSVNYLMTTARNWAADHLDGMQIPTPDPGAAA